MTLDIASRNKCQVSPKTPQNKYFDTQKISFGIRTAADNRRQPHWLVPSSATCGKLPWATAYDVMGHAFVGEFVFGTCNVSFFLRYSVVFSAAVLAVLHRDFVWQAGYTQYWTVLTNPELFRWMPRFPAYLSPHSWHVVLVHSLHRGLAVLHVQGKYDPTGLSLLHRSHTYGFSDWHSLLLQHRGSEGLGLALIGLVRGAEGWRV